MTEPRPFDPTWPRYSLRPFPSYRYVPGQTQHPRRYPFGHSYGNPEPTPRPFPPNEWQASDDYRYGIDLYNFAYWWESHEIFEAFWHAAGRHSEQGNFFQGLIQLAAANLKRVMGKEAAAQNLTRAGITRLERCATPCMGVEVSLTIQALQEYLSGTHPHLPLIRLQDGTSIFGGEIQP